MTDLGLISNIYKYLKNIASGKKKKHTHTHFKNGQKN